MKMNRQTVLLTILIVVSVGSNILNMFDAEIEYVWPTEARYTYEGMFNDSVLWYRPEGTESLGMINMDEAVITIVELGAPLNCAQLNIHTKDGTIPGPCIAPIESEAITDE